MKLARHLYGGAPVIMPYQVGATVSNVGVPLLSLTAAGDSGLIACTTTGAANMVGISLDTATYVITQQTALDAERLVKVDIRPDAVYKVRLSNDGTTGTAQANHAVTTASAAGTVVTTSAFDWNGTDLDEGTVWCYSGANIGQVRKITSTSSTSATVTVPFENDTVVGDNFRHANFHPLDAQSETVTLTSDFLELDCSVATATNGAEFNCIQIIVSTVNDSSGDAYALLISDDHALNKLA